MALIGRWISLGSCLLILLLVGGCYPDYGPVVVEPAPAAPVVSVAHRLQAGDRVNVIVFGEANLTGIYIVDPSGGLSLPLIGTVTAAGRTRAEIEREITSKYRAYVTEPKVTIAVVEFRPFYVLGEAEHPGQYPYYSGLNVLTAISTAGGVTYRGSRTTVLIERAGEDVWRKYPMVADVPVLPGDLIRIPERFF